MIFLLLLGLTFTELMSLDLKQLITVMNNHQYLKYLDLKKAKRQLIKGLIKRKHSKVFSRITTAKVLIILKYLLEVEALLLMYNEHSFVPPHISILSSSCQLIFLYKIVFLYLVFSLTDT